ncbi:hypothetical protein diail_11130, partial [Diaporthe ilicicola]
MPLTTLENVNLFDNLTYIQPLVAKDEAEVGYYKTRLQNGVTAEISASMHAGIMKYQFPEDGDGKYVLVDIPRRGLPSLFSAVISTIHPQNLS